jgi:type I restriction enzyme, S subunit
MIDGLRPYPKYKDSGLPWLPKIPASWSVVRNGRLFTQRNKTGHSNLPILEVSLRSGVRVRDMKDGGRKQVMSDRSKYKQARAGDLAYNTMRMWQGAVGVAPVDGLVSPAYVVAMPVPDVDAAYFAQLYRTAEYMREIDTYSRGIVKDRNRLYWEAFKQIATPCPPLGEQASIIRFLGHVRRKVSLGIQSKQALVRLLDEEKRTTIRGLVTSGISGALSVPPRGSSRSEDLRPGWTYRKLRHCGAIVGGMTPSMSRPSFWGGCIPWVTPKDMKRPELSDSLDRVTDDALRFTSLHMLPAGAVLLVVRGMILARRIPIAVTTRALTINQDMKALVPKPDIIPKFLARAMSSAEEALALLIDESGHGTRRLPTERWREVTIPVPPLQEQVEILACVETVEARLDTAIARAEAEVRHLREYHDRLVGKIVMGRIDVRDAARRSADVLDVREQLDRLDPMALDEDETDHSAHASTAEEVRA